MNKILLLISFSLVLQSNSIFSQVNQTENNFDLEQTKKRLTQEITKILEETGIPSISLSLIKDDSIVWSEAFGYANVKKKLPATSSTIYSTGSNFKFVTATAIMQLAEAGKLDIDNPINDYLGESSIEDLSSEGMPVTFRHLLSHHSGLKGPIEIKPIWERKLPKTLKEIASEISAEEPPGINYKYCNHCYALAGLAIEKISGQSFQDYIVKHILEPLQIKSKGPVIPTPVMVEELALPYYLNNNKSFPEHQYRFDVFPAGDIYLTPEEMAHFYIAQMNHGSFEGQTILNSKSVQMMHEAQFGSFYGLGTRLIKKGDMKYLFHTGGVPGFTTYSKVELTSKKGVYIASNAGNIRSILAVIADLSLKLLNGDSEIDPLQSFKIIQVTEEVLNKYKGKYQLAPDNFITITQQGTHLYGQITGQEKFELFAYENDKFFHKIVDVRIKFNTENGKTTSLTLFQDGETIGKKIE